jgi:phosphatidylglycerophosphate synthase
MRCFLVEKSGEISTNWKGKFDIIFQDRLYFSCMLLCLILNGWSILSFFAICFYFFFISNFEIIGYKNLLYFKRCIIEMVGRKIAIKNTFIIKFKKIILLFLK